MSPMVLFEAAWLESPASQSGLAKVVEPLKAPEAWRPSKGCWKDGPVFLGFGPGLGPGQP